MRSRGFFPKLLAWAAVLGYMGVIFYFSHQPAVPVPPPFPHFDKLLHFLAYFVLGALTANALVSGGIKRRFFTALAVASLYGVSDEFHQSFIPGRDPSAMDWLADTIGAWFGAYLYLRTEKYFTLRRRPRGALPPS